MRYCLDTNTAIYFLAGRLSEHLPEGEWVISVITELELRSYSFATPGDERRVAEFIEQISVVDLTPEIKTLTITMRREKLVEVAGCHRGCHSACSTSHTDHERYPPGSGIRRSLHGAFVKSVVGIAILKSTYG